jgi:hypothetical protein
MAPEQGMNGTVTHQTFFAPVNLKAESTRHIRAVRLRRFGKRRLRE